MKKIAIAMFALAFTLSAWAIQSDQLWKIRPHVHFDEKTTLSIVYGGEDVKKLKASESFTNLIASHSDFVA